MKECLSISCTPSGENCASVGDENYLPRAKAEIDALKGQMIRLVGEPPAGAQLRMKGFPHDFGTYHELCVVYNFNDEEAEEYAFKCEDALPEYWDEIAIAELAKAGFPVATMERV